MSEEHPAGWNELYASHTFHEITMYYPMRVVRGRQYKLIWNLAHPLPYPFASDLWEAPTWDANKALYMKLAVNDEGRCENYPGFDEFYKGLNTRLDADEIRGGFRLDAGSACTLQEENELPAADSRNYQARLRRVRCCRFRKYKQWLVW